MSEGNSTTKKRCHFLALAMLCRPGQTIRARNYALPDVTHFEHRAPHRAAAKDGLCRRQPRSYQRPGRWLPEDSQTLRRTPTQNDSRAQQFQVHRQAPMQPSRYLPSLRILSALKFEALELRALLQLDQVDKSWC